MNIQQRKAWRPHQPIRINNNQFAGLMRQKQANDAKVEDKFDRLVRRELERQAAAARV